MKKYFTVTKAEVKTIFDIKIEHKDVWKIIEAAKNDVASKWRWQSKKCPLSECEEDAKHIEVIKNFFSMWYGTLKYDTATIDYIVTDIFGFDGVVNYGYIYDDDTIMLQVYKFGDTIN